MTFPNLEKRRNKASLVMVLGMWKTNRLHPSGPAPHQNQQPTTFTPFQQASAEERMGGKERGGMNMKTWVVGTRHVWTRPIEKKCLWLSVWMRCCPWMLLKGAVLPPPPVSRARKQRSTTTEVLLTCRTASGGTRTGMVRGVSVQASMCILPPRSEWHGRFNQDGTGAKSQHPRVCSLNLKSSNRAFQAFKPGRKSNLEPPCNCEVHQKCRRRAWGAFLLLFWQVYLLSYNLKGNVCREVFVHELLAL